MFVYLNNILLVTIVNGRDVEKQGRRVNEGCRYSFVLMVVMLKAEENSELYLSDGPLSRQRRSNYIHNSE